MDELIRRVQTAFLQLRRSLDSDLLKRMDNQVTGAQMFVLHYISRHGKCKLSQIADKLDVKPSAITVMIDRLEKHGYVERMPDPADRRSILVDLTTEGNKVLEHAVQVRSDILSVYLSRLEPHEAPVLAELLEKLAGTTPDEK